MKNCKKILTAEKTLKRLTSLTPKEKEKLIKEIAMRNKGKTLEEIGKNFNITIERIKEIEKKALERLNKNQPEPPDEAA